MLYSYKYPIKKRAYLLKKTIIKNGVSSEYEEKRLEKIVIDCVRNNIISFYTNQIVGKYFALCHTINSISYWILKKIS
jgi:hypothetical protein